MTEDLKFYKFIIFLNRLKDEVRYKGVKNMKGDNTAAHTWRLTMMVVLASAMYDLKINLLKAIKIALVHDLVEIIAKDTPRSDRVKKNITDEEIFKKEKSAIKEIKKLAPKKIGQELEDLWEEYENKKTKEARIVSSLDKMEGLMNFFEKGKPAKFYSDYIATYANKYFKNTPELKKLYPHLHNEMKASYKKNNIEWKSEYEKI